MTVPPHVLILWVGLLIGAATDLRAGKIPNVLTFPMMALGVVTHLVLGPDPWLGLMGLGAAFVVHFVGFALGIEKAGDAKLMMGLGACVGWHEMLEATLWMAVLYLPLGLAILAMRGKLGNLIAVAKYSADKALGRPVAEEKPEATWLITGPIIAAAGILANLTPWLDASRWF